MQPTIIEDSISIAANSVNQNVIVSNPSLRGLLNAPHPSRIKLLAIQSALGLTFDASHGSQLYAAACVPRIATVMQEPNDVINGDAYCQAQEQMILRVSNTTGGALDFRYRLELTPVVDDTWQAGNVDLPPDAVVMQSQSVVTAGDVDEQLLDGLTFEQLAVPAVLKVLMTGTAAGLLRQLFIDQDRIAPPSAVNPANRIPMDPFDTTIAGVEVPANARQYLSISNPTGGNITVTWKTIAQKLVRD